MGFDINKEKLSAFLVAYTLGSTSPNRRIKNVIRMTSIKKRIFSSISFIKTAPSTEKRSTINILIKLFVMRMVANNFLGLLRNFNTRFPFGVFDFDKSSKVVLDKEKKATSVPEIMAENTNRHIKTITSKIMYQGNELRNAFMGSGSNSIRSYLIKKANHL